MAISTAAPDTTAILQTDAGPIHAWAQTDRTILVTAGPRDGKGDAAAPLAIAGGEFGVHAHFKHRDGQWKPWSPSIHRTDQPGRPPTSRMERAVTGAIADALDKWARTVAGAAALAHARKQAGDTAATERLVVAVELRRIADHLDAEARALHNGGRVTYRRRTLKSGADEHVTRIETAAGELLPPCPEPPTVYGAARYPDAAIRHEEETD